MISSSAASGVDSPRRASSPFVNFTPSWQTRFLASTSALMALRTSPTPLKKDSAAKRTKGGRPIPPRSKVATALAKRKMTQLGPAKTTPYPSFASPTEEECEAVSQALEREHGKPPQRERARFEDDEEGAEQTDRGIADGVLDAVIRCILTLNTNARVSNRSILALRGTR